jgi:hypothetical protein
MTILLGRFFCGWLCPFGALHQAVGWLANRGRKASAMIAANRYRRGQGIKYAILVFLLGAAAGDLIGRLLRLAVGAPWVVVGIVAVLLLVGTVVHYLRTISGIRWATGVVVVAIGWMVLGLFTDGSRLLGRIPADRTAGSHPPVLPVGEPDPAAAGGRPPGIPLRRQPDLPRRHLPWAPSSGRRFFSTWWSRAFTAASSVRWGRCSACWGKTPCGGSASGPTAARPAAPATGIVKAGASRQPSSTPPNVCCA